MLERDGEDDVRVSNDSTCPFLVQWFVSTELSDL